MTYSANSPGRTAGPKLSRQAAYIMLFLFPAFLLIQSCKLDAPIIPESLLHPKPADTIPTNPQPPAGSMDTVIKDTITPATANFNRFKGWAVYKANPAGSYNMLLIGDSYTQGNFYSWRLRGKLLDNGFNDGGPGYDSFGRWDPTQMYSIDASMDANELTFTYDPLVWQTSKGNYYGPCGNVSNTVPDALITVSSKVALKTYTIIFERHADAGDFRYRINGGSWTTVSAANAVEDIASVEINVESAGSNINLDIQSIKAGQVFAGVVGRRGGDVLTLDKIGSSGTTANFFGNNPLWEKSIEVLKPKGAIIMFGTNEMDGNVSPADMKVNVQHIINQLKQAQPNCDIMIMCPPQTLYENEDPRKYKIANYADMLFRLALQNKAAFVDFAKVFPPFSQASVDAGIMDQDRKHPGDAGSELMAKTIFNGLKK